MMHVLLISILLPTRIHAQKWSEVPNCIGSEWRGTHTNTLNKETKSEGITTNTSDKCNNRETVKSQDTAQAMSIL